MKKIFTFIVAAAFATVSMAQSIPNWTKTATPGSGGATYELHDVLSNGNYVLLDFMATWCGPCQSSTPSIQQMWEDYGEGSGGFYAFAMDVDDSETATQLDNFGTTYGGDYPAFIQCSSDYSFYNSNWGSGGIPLFILLTPNTSDPASSTVDWSQVGWGTGQEINQMEAVLANGGVFPTGIASSSADDKVNVYPNPANESATLYIEQGQAINMNISIYNVVGQEIESVLNGSVSGTKTITLNTSNYDSGIYFIKVKRGDNEETIKFNVAH